MIENIVKYIVWKLEDGECSISKTKIVKLLYLIDLEYFRRYRKTLSGYAWKYHYYGPYAFEIDELLDRLSLDLPQEEVRTSKGYRAYIFRSAEDADIEYKESVPQREQLIVNRILRQWGPDELNPILSYVYFDTEPMQHAQPGDYLNFEHVQAPRLERELDESQIRLSSDEMSYLERKFEDYSQEQISLAQMTAKQGKLLPSPRNKAYVNAKRIMDYEEQRPMPVNVDVVMES